MERTRATAIELGLTALIALGLALPIIGLYGNATSQRMVAELRWPELLATVLAAVAGRLGLIRLRFGDWRGAAAVAAAMIAAGMLLIPPSAPFGLPMVSLSTPGRLDASLPTGIKAAMVGGGLVILIRALLRAFRRTGEAAPSKASGEAFLARNANRIAIAIGLFALLLPALVWPLDSAARILDVMTLILTYILLAWGLNIVVGYAGLLDLGFVAFYAVGAYSFVLIATHTDLGFFQCLPIAGLLAACAGLLLGVPVLRLRGDYFAIVTLGFGEIIKVVLQNWDVYTGGPNGLSNVPKPSLFGLEFIRRGSEGHPSFAETLGLAFDPLHKKIYYYLLALLLTFAVGWFTTRIRRLPIGRAWEALREDDIACAALGLSRTRLKLAAFALSATWGGFAGAFFALRQGFISPESFGFLESAMILAIVVLGGMGNLIGIALAAVLLIGLPEAFRELQSYRMLAFGAGMVAIMLWRPSGLISFRAPSVLLEKPGGQR